ncbi:hypothetical protein LCGC14_1049070 [marine sediment metagenome]|uniref:Uncharacterized protein n=1 Tax=marine sediment metagenome TaxID=412755 RepID=A0A0F9MTS8_9ZZZZ
MKRMTESKAFAIQTQLQLALGALLQDSGNKRVDRETAKFDDGSWFEVVAYRVGGRQLRADVNERGPA